MRVAPRRDGPYKLRSAPLDLPFTLRSKCAKYKPGPEIARTLRRPPYVGKMTSKKDPPKPPFGDQKVTEGPFAGQPLEVLVQVLATAAGQMRGIDGKELEQHVRDLTAQVQVVAQQVEAKVHDEDVRQKTAQEVERLIDVFVRTGSAAGQALAGFREPVVKAFQGVSLDKMAEGMRMLADWLQNPTSETEAQVKELMEGLQKTMGPMVGHDPEREEQARRDAIKADVKKSLDGIFGGKTFGLDPSADPAKKKS